MLITVLEQLYLQASLQVSANVFSSEGSLARFFHFEILLAPSDLLLPSAEKAAWKGLIGLAG